MYHILMSAYACEPGAGSEYGVGWMVPTTMARKYPEHQFYVLTRSRCREKIEKVLASDSTLANLHFLFYDIPSWMFYKNEMKSNWGEQINYLLWQLLSRRYVRKMHKTLHFDLFHHLTFNQYRTPSPGFWLDIPFVMGPIGGAECIAPAFWQDLEANTIKKEKIRREGKDLKIFSWFNNRRNNKKVILCSSDENLQRLQPFGHHSDFLEMPAIAFDVKDFALLPNQKTSEDTFEMVYAGKAWDWKGIKIFLNAVKLALGDSKQGEAERTWIVKLIGIRFESEQKQVMEWVEEFGLQDHVTIIPFIERKELLKLMKGCSLSVYPAFRDSGSMSVLEACAIGCPTVCFDAGGQSVFPNDILLKVHVEDTYNETLERFASSLRWGYEHPIELKTLGEKAKSWVEANLTWEKRVEDFYQIYRKLLES